MSVDYAIPSWSYAETKKPLASFDWFTHYAPAPVLKGDNTAISSQLVEALLTDCGSGSRCAEAFALLKKQITSTIQPGDWQVLTLSIDDVAAEAEAAPPTMVEKLEAIRDAFGLSAGSLAEVLKASRASVYNWLEDEPPTERFVQRIDLLHSIAKDWVEITVYHFPPGKLMKQKLGDGPSMQDRLRREDLDMEEIRRGLQDLLALMRSQRQKMDRAKARSERAAASDAERRELLERITGSVTVDESQETPKMPNRKRLIELGWKQGILLSAADVALRRGAHYKIDDTDRLLIVSQTCDLVQGSFEREPYFEVLCIHPLGHSPSGECQGGKNSRRIEFSLGSADQLSHWYAQPFERHVLSRESLVDGRTPGDAIDDDNVLTMILHWLSRRYTRTAFPETFVDRLNAKKKEIAKKFKQINPYVSGVYIRLTPFDELDSGSNYEVEMILVMEADRFDDVKQHRACAEISKQLEGQMAKCQGLEILNVELESTASLTFEQLKGFREWDYSYLSFRDPDNSAAPTNI